MTPHISAKKEEIAKTVLMPGDPLRAKFFAEKYLENPRLVSSVRNVLFYTGTYKGKEVTIGASGMGFGSMGIYSFELFKFYDVDNIIRIGSTGAYCPSLTLKDIVLVETSIADSPEFSWQVRATQDVEIKGSEDLNKKILDSASKLGVKLVPGRVHSSNVFYGTHDWKEMSKKLNAISVEMESFALFTNAKKLNKNAACLVTVSNSIVRPEEDLTPEEREKNMTSMIEVVLEAL